MHDAPPQADSHDLADSDANERLTPIVHPLVAERASCSADHERMGGDPPCWAHLFEDEAPSP